MQIQRVSNGNLTVQVSTTSSDLAKTGLALLILALIVKGVEEANRR